MRQSRLLSRHQRRLLRDKQNIDLRGSHPGVIREGPRSETRSRQMFITKRHIPRRTILKGAGAALALPLLEAMVPARTLLAQTAAVPAKSRFVGIFFPHGMGPGHWVPKAEGALTDMPYTLESLKNVKDKTVVLSGLWSKSAEPPEG